MDSSIKSTSFITRDICVVQLEYLSLSNSCISLGKITLKEGTETTDAKCSNGASSYVLPLILSVSAVCVLVFAI